MTIDFGGNGLKSLHLVCELPKKEFHKKYVFIEISLTLNIFVLYIFINDEKWYNLEGK